MWGTQDDPITGVSSAVCFSVWWVGLAQWEGMVFWEWMAARISMVLKRQAPGTWFLPICVGLSPTGS